jgi:hypothetical protein
VVKAMMAGAALFIYGYYCAATMPRDCFTRQHAVYCQQVQLGLLINGQQVAWATIDRLRRF